MSDELNFAKYFKPLRADAVSSIDGYLVWRACPASWCRIAASHGAPARGRGGAGTAGGRRRAASGPAAGPAWSLSYRSRVRSTLEPQEASIEGHPQITLPVHFTVHSHFIVAWDKPLLSLRICTSHLYFNEAIDGSWKLPFVMPPVAVCAYRTMLRRWQAAQS